MPWGTGPYAENGEMPTGTVSPAVTGAVIGTVNEPLVSEGVKPPALAKLIGAVTVVGKVTDCVTGVKGASVGNAVAVAVALADGTDEPALQPASEIPSNALMISERNFMDTPTGVGRYDARIFESDAQAEKWFVAPCLRGSQSVMR